MKYDVSAHVPNGGWSLTVEADSPQHALLEAMNHDNHPNGRALKIDIRDHIPPMPQTEAYAGCMMSLPAPLLTVTR